ncbi:MAG TPA: hypothetical protein VIV63_13600 [Steroidobacteraceae bacterium]
MTIKRKHLARIGTVAAAFLPAFALAHPGHGDTSTFFGEVMHQLSWQHALGFLFSGAALIAAGVAAIRLWSSRLLKPNHTHRLRR